jgi:hypothetical protein
MKVANVVAMLSAVAVLLLVPVRAVAALEVVPQGQPNGFVAETADTQAGAHADGVTSFNLNPTPVGIQGGGLLKDVIVDLPPGLIGNPRSVSECRLEELTNGGETGTAEAQRFCPIASQIGTVDLRVGVFPGFSIPAGTVPLYNIVPTPGTPAVLGFVLRGTNTPIILKASIRPDDYGLRVTSLNASQFLSISGVTVHIWAIPADSSHDIQRCPTPGQKTFSSTCDNDPESGSQDVDEGLPHASGIARQPFFSNPTACDGPKVTKISVSSWAEQQTFTTQTAQSPTPTGCDKLTFDPDISVQPTTEQADSPTGLSVDLTIPQNSDPGGLATAQLKDTKVTLPQEIGVNPASADALGGCSPAQIGLGTNDPVRCPGSSKIGSLRVQTPLLPDTLDGSIFLASQNQNPFNSLLALYLVIDDPDTGVLVKIPGTVAPDEVTGQLEASFFDNPQIPFESLHLEFKSGSRAPLITPGACGEYATEASFASWAAPEGAVELSDSFKITSGPGGAPCPSPAQFDPGFEAGTVTPIAGTYSPLVVNASRPDGSQSLRGLAVNLPPGLTGKLAGVPYCPEAAIATAAARNQPGQGALELASPSCPAASKVGTVDVAAGAGSTPFHVQGNAYLAGPYKGAPLSLVVITPAIAGPFDLGAVLVRAALRVDPATAQITAVSDPIPQILQGIPLKIRSVSVNTDKPGFTLNPTSCDPFTLSGTLLGTSASKPVSNRFQVGACNALDFKPKLSLKLLGPTGRSKDPALRAILTQPAGQANIARVSVVLPKSAFIDNAHISNPCTRPQFNANACPKKSILGTARAFTPLLDQPLEGPVYFRANGGERDLPDIVADLNGQIHVTLVGFIDSVKKKGSETSRVRSTFALVPDAPVSKFVMSLKGGKVGLIENSANLCRSDQHATIKMDAQSGKVYDTRPLIGNDCGKGKKAKRRG